MTVEWPYVDIEWRVYADVDRRLEESARVSRQVWQRRQQMRGLLMLLTGERYDDFMGRDLGLELTRLGFEPTDVGRLVALLYANKSSERDAPGTEQEQS